MVDIRFNRRVTYDLGFAIAFLLALHGISAFKILIILYLNYAIGTAPLSKPTVAGLTWIFNIGILFANELARGYEFRRNVPALGWLDAYGGLIPRWEVLFNFTVLRLIAFNFDYIWAQGRGASSLLEVSNVAPSRGRLYRDPRR